MSITNRDLPAGTKLRATYKKVEHVCTVEAGEEGKLAYVLADGKRFTSPPLSRGLSGHGRVSLQRLAILDRGRRGAEAGGQACGDDAEAQRRWS